MVRKSIHIIMGILYAFIGVFILTQKWFLIELQSWASIALGILFILYGIFRIYRAVTAIKARND